MCTLGSPNRPLAHTYCPVKGISCPVLPPPPSALCWHLPTAQGPQAPHVSGWGRRVSAPAWGGAPELKPLLSDHLIFPTPGAAWKLLRIAALC